MPRRPRFAVLLAACLCLAAVQTTLARDAVDVPAAVQATVDTGSLGIDMVFSISGQSQDGIQTLRMSGTGGVELGPERRMHLAMDMTDFGLGALELILADRLLYVRGDAWADELGETGWIGVDLASVDPSVDEWRDLVSGQNDASMALYWLLGGTTAPAAVKRERVGDVLSERLVMHLDLELALDRVPADLRPLLEQVISEARAQGIEPLFEADVWVGDDGLVHRAKYAFEDLPQGVTDMAVTYDFHDFGEPLDLELPDPADVLVLGGSPTE